MSAIVGWEQAGGGEGEEEGKHVPRGGGTRHEKACKGGRAVPVDGAMCLAELGDQHDSSFKYDAKFRLHGTRNAVRCQFPAPRDEERSHLDRSK